MTTKNTHKKRLCQATLLFLCSIFFGRIMYTQDKLVKAAESTAYKHMQGANNLLDQSGQEHYKNRLAINQDIGGMGQNTSIGLHGDIISQHMQEIDGSVIDRVVLYAQENAQSNKKITRNGVLVRNKDAKATILIAHGFMCDKYYAGFFRAMFPQKQYNFMTFDFRAHGDEINGQYCTFGHDEAYDVIAAAKFIKNHADLQDKPLYVYGFSMGAVASIEAQAKEQNLFDAMILDCPFDSSENVIKNALSGMHVSVFGYQFDLPGRQLLEAYAFHPYVQSLVKFALKISAGMDTKHMQTQFLPISPVESIKKVAVPCLFIHCRNDDRVSVAAVKSIFDNAPGHKKLWITNGRGHFDSYFYHPERYADHVQKFLSQMDSGQYVRDDSGAIFEDSDEYVAHKG